MSSALNMERDIGESVLAAIDRDEVMDLAMEMVKFPSFTMEETEVARYVADYSELMANPSRQQGI